MAFAKGNINITKLLNMIEQHPEALYKSSYGDDMLNININFHNRLSESGKNVTISLFDKTLSNANPIFGNAKLDFNHLKHEKLI